MRALLRFLSRDISEDSTPISHRHRGPAEAIALRSMGLAWSVGVLFITFASHPRPSLHGRGIAILIGVALLYGGVFFLRLPRDWSPVEERNPGNDRRTILGLLIVTAGAIVLRETQAHGIWIAGPYLVAIISAIGLDRRVGTVMVFIGLAPLTVWALIQGQFGTALSTSVGILPWYLILRLTRMLGDRNRALDASRAAEAQAAVLAERGRMAREMHDVLAHSLSALALQLESTKLLAREHGSDPEIERAIDRAHSLAASGLDDARRAIAAARGEDLPGPERLEALTGAFEEQSGLPIALEVHGEPRELPPDARLAVYRTAQEALTNIRRHAVPEQVQVRLDYLPDHTILVVEDHASHQPPPLAAMSVSGGYGLTGMRERAELLGGELSAAPTPDGFRVELRLPA